MVFNKDIEKNNNEVDMVFSKNVDKNIIEEFENNCLEKISKSPMLILLKSELIKKNLSFKIEVQHTEPNLKKYCSHLVIDIFNDKGERVCEYDEPNCCLMLCETICFMRNGYVVGIDLLTDKEFLESLELLIKQVKIDGLVGLDGGYFKRKEEI